MENKICAREKFKFCKRNDKKIFKNRTRFFARCNQLHYFICIKKFNISLQGATPDDKCQ